MRTWVRVSLVTAWLAALAVPQCAQASLSTPGFRAVGVAHTESPVSALTVAPDGRLFVAVQAVAQTAGTDPGTAEIRVYGTYATTDGAVLDEGAVWATIDGVRATSNQEGVLGLALAPDFASSGLLYLYLSTTDEEVNQHVRVYRENGAGVGELVGTVKAALEPPTEAAARTGGGLGFGADGCLYAGIGDNGGNNRWNAQVLVGTDPIQSGETTAFCSDVCLGATEYPTRTIDHDGALNHAGKVVRLAVEGDAAAQPADGAPLVAQPFVFGAGLRNPTGLVTHPLTGQLFVADRGDVMVSEINLVESGTNHGWPCLDGGVVAGNAACLVGLTPADVYGHHPAWRPPVAIQAGSGAVNGPAVYAGLAYPAEFFGDLFYVLRDGTRIFRLDLAPPCFVPDAAGMAAVAFHDSADDGDFVVTYDFDDDGEMEDRFFGTLVALAQAPDPLGRQVLYVAGKQSDSNGLTDDTVIFRIEYTTAFTPHAGPVGRVDDACFTASGYENPFHRPTCLPPGGGCPGAADGTPCGDGDACNGDETCTAGVCRHGATLPDGTTCQGANGCGDAFTCLAGTCVAGSTLPDGASCTDGDPCNGRETCAAGVCTTVGGPDSLGVGSLVMKRETKGPGSGSLRMTARVRPSAPIAPATSDALTLEVRDTADVLFAATLSHPASDPWWGRKGKMTRYLNKGAFGSLGTVTLRTLRSADVEVQLRGKGLAFSGLDEPLLRPRLVIGDQCFVSDLAGRCVADPKKLRCR